jgi:beta-glucuronidase
MLCPKKQGWELRLKRFLGIMCLAAAPALGAEANSISLNGAWTFAPDYLDSGERSEWQLNVNAKDPDWAQVTVPHCWSIDRRYPDYVGAGWYRREFDAPNMPRSARAALHFEAVFYRAKVWLNGKLVGEHEGGYTPFEWDVTELLAAGQANHLVVKADNRWDAGTIPGARPGTRPRDFLYPWWDYGGITRDVELVITPPVSGKRLRVVTKPDVDTRTAALEASVVVVNTSDVAVNAHARWTIIKPDGTEDRDARRDVAVHLAPHQTNAAQLSTTIRDAQLWDLDRPALYRAQVTIETSSIKHELQTEFGIRKVEARDGTLFLNGHSIRLGGANRVMDDPEFGPLEPDAVVDRDLRQMKEAGMELMRIAHYPLAPSVLRWADHHGMLLIEEAGGWGLVEAQLDSPGFRGKLQAMAREMIERDWNHPSIIGWSVGNEYASNLPAGIRWTRDMREYFRGIDASRLITFADNHYWQPNVHSGLDDGSQFSDLIGINLYGSVESVVRRLDLIHKLYPDKPAMLTEWGLRNDQVKNEAEREQYVRDVIAEIRKRPWIVGASLWTYNDYRSRFPGTNPNGFRPWGTVDYHRKPYGMYDTVRNEFAAVRVERMHAESGRGMVKVSARVDFPSLPAAGYSLVVGQKRYPLPVLDPGKSMEVPIDKPEDGAPLAIERPGGYRSFTTVWSVQ